MDSNKNKQQNFTRSKACQSTESNCNRKSNTDLQTNKPWPRNSRRRDQPSAARNDSQRNSKQFPSVKARSNVDKRPRPRGGAGVFLIGGAGPAADDGEDVSEGVHAASTGLAPLSAAASGTLAKHSQEHEINFELNSVYAQGSKKQNLNHLLNFNYTPRESDYAMGMNIFGRGGSSGSGMHRHNQNSGGVSKRHKYNKEQFLQANFQFVIRSSAKPSLTGSPDTLIDWDLIEQINIQTTEEPQCPICLYPPIAAKLTRCGHAYCWPCILHYLALSDKSWRKCPICYEAIHTADLKSTTIVQQQQLNLGDLITFQLMRRKKGSMFIEKFNSQQTTSQTVFESECYPQVSGSSVMKLFSKFLIAKSADILDIIEREQRELLTDDDPTCPEFVFIQQALDMLRERREKLMNSLTKEDHDDDDKPLIDLTEEREDTISTEIELEPKPQINEEHLSETEKEISLLNVTVIGSGKYYYFYQSEDGQNIYLHPLNVKMLQACYGTLDRGPLVINARVLQKEHHSMDEEHRRKFTCLGHLPLTCQFAVVEVDLQPPIVTDKIMRLFKDDLMFRKKERLRREREERKREKQINEINDRQMGKLIASTAQLNLSSAAEFPTCGFEEALPSRAEAVDDVGFLSQMDAKSSAVAAPKRHVSYSTVAVVGESPTVEEYWPTLASPSPSSIGANNMYRELSSWGKNASSRIGVSQRGAPSERSSESESNLELMSGDIESAATSPLRTELGDVLAMAMSQKKQNMNTSAASKKTHKKAKKMQPLFSTGINYNGN